MVNKMLLLSVAFTLIVVGAAFTPAADLSECEMHTRLINGSEAVYCFDDSGCPWDYPHCKTLFVFQGLDLLLFCSCQNDGGEGFSPAGDCVGVATAHPDGSLETDCINISCGEPCQKAEPIPEYWLPLCICP